MVSREVIIKDLNEELARVPKFTRDDVFNTFEPYVEDKKRLHEYVDFGIFTFDYVHFKGVVEGTIFEDALALILSMFKQAYSIDPDSTSELYRQNYYEIAKGLAGYTQTALINNDAERPETERIDIFVRKAFTIIGDNIEGSLQPHLRLLDGIQRICNGKPVRDAKLGIVSNDIISSDNIFRAAYKDLFFDISVSQWRNIACHNDYVVNLNDSIDVTYGGTTKCYASFSRDDLIRVLTTLDELLYMHKTVHTLLGIDYGELLNVVDVISKKSKNTISDDSVIQLAETAYAYGLTLKSMKEDNQFEFCIRDSENIKRDEIESFAIVLSGIVQKDYTADVLNNDRVVYKLTVANRELHIYAFHSRG